MRQEELRPAVYHRLHRLVPFVSHPAVRAGWRWALRAAVVLYFAFVLLVLGLRYLILPNIENYRPEIERAAGEALGRAVAIGGIEASWAGLNPDLVLSDVRIADAQGQPALAFSRVESVLSWSSLPRLQLRLRLLRIDEPTLHLRRDRDGRFFIAGIAVTEDDSDGGVVDWVLAQKQIRVNGATVLWEDARRGAPPLVLENVNLTLENDGRQHRFGLSALPPAELASAIDLRGDFRGRDLESAASWKGQAFVQVDHIDLAAWRAWIDYPFALPNGRGAIRAWAGFAAGTLQELTADLSLASVNLRLAKNLPELALDRLSGRIPALRSHCGAVSARRAAARRPPRRAPRAVAGGTGGCRRRCCRGSRQSAQAPELRIEPTDFHLEWQQEKPPSASLRGSATASVVDLGVFGGLAAYLPLDPQSRRLLDEFAPRGRIGELRASWRGSAEELQAYSLQGSFTDLALRPVRQFPGASGLSGSLDASEKGGAVQLRSRQVRVELPLVFPESAIALETLNAQAKWKITQGQVEAELSRLEFAGADAAGSAQGTYRSNPEGPGRIDLTAALTRAEATAVWRYLPAAINVDARHWLRDALKEGRASEARLILKGDLANFPFLDRKQGQFLVTVKAEDVVLDYGTGWPPIKGIDADLRFEGNGMVVQARHGSILGATLTQTRAEIPDFDAPVSTLKLKGQVAGPTAEFLKYIDQSPVAAQIDHFTEKMSARGTGRLEIALVIPLEEARLGESRIDGTYTFKANEVVVDPVLPPLQQVTGQLQFSEKDLRVPEITATLFGGPLRITGGTQAGKVRVLANGALAVDDLRRHIDSPVLAGLTGGTSYRAEIRVRKRDVDVLVDSDLVGVTSTLPAPLGKPASEAMPLHFENGLLPAAAASAGGQGIVRDQVRATLGNALSLHLIRRKQGNEAQVERGMVMVGRPAGALPERGLNLGISARRIDLDEWDKLLGGGRKGNEGGGAGLPVAVDVKADELVVLGHTYTGVGVGITGITTRWRGNVETEQAAGTFQWDGSGAGRLKAHFSKWRRPDRARADVAATEPLKELPALDVVVDDFAIGQKRFGRLEVQAHNDGGIWRLDKIDLRNPYGSLSGSGQWQLSAANRTQLDFTLESSDVGRLLDRLGYGGTVRAGKATMKGRIGWNGAPAELDHATLSGDIQVEASKGQFLKVDPGAGKLLGLISLQGLPRRFTFDFGDIFSEGFAFDSIAGSISVRSGVMHTDRLLISGPAARVLMSGEADLKNETQRLEVSVQPDLGSSAALGVAVINPLAGVATLLADKILQGPLSKAFSFDYLVTGRWDDPKVERLSRPPAVATTP
ncbi:MAG: putative protein involved in outer membrane biogenesis [Candidatus Accumulibacter sp. BA-94]|nr:MAG: putative protein involved in outer membrane biogenesis [Candidatus Accumulibacter sp. BA-94]